MKHLYTFVAGLLCSAQLFAQTINETFANYTSTAQMTANCWSFYGAGLTNTTGLNTPQSIEIIPATSNSNTGNSNVGQIITPYVDLLANTLLTYNVKISSPLSTQANRTVSVRTLSTSGIASAPISTFTLNRNSLATQIYLVSVTIPVTGTYRLIFDITGNGDGNTYTYFDNIVYGSTWSTQSCMSSVSGAPLPVRLIEYSGSLVNRKAQLRWSVTENETGDRFELEKSADGRSFTTSMMLFNTSKVGAEQYTYTESAELKSAAYFRIRIVNKNGSVSYSRILLLRPAGSATAEGLTLNQNPVSNTLGFQYTASEPGAAQATVYSMTGARMLTKNLSVQAGSNSIAITLDGALAPGTYVLEIHQNGVKQIAKLIKN